MEYSAVTQPRPVLRSQPGTPCSTVALVSTRVFPNETRTEPSAVWTKPGVRVSGRSSAGLLPPGRKKGVEAGTCIKGLYGTVRVEPSWPGRPGSRPRKGRSRNPEREFFYNQLKSHSLLALSPKVRFYFGTNRSHSVLADCPGIGQ